MERVHVRSVAEQIAVELSERIAEGEYRPGDGLPTDAEIAQRWEVSIDVARTVLGQLKAHGLVQPEVGRGIVVTGRRAGVSPADQFRRGAQQGRVRLDNERSRLIRTGTMPVLEVEPWIAATVGVGSTRGEALFRQRVILRDGRPICVVTSWVAITALSTQRGWQEAERRLLAQEPIVEGTPSLLGELVGEPVAREDYAASAEQASAEDADLLEVGVGSPVLRVIATVHSQRWPLECGVYVFAAGETCAFPSALLHRRT